MPGRKGKVEIPGSPGGEKQRGSSLCQLVVKDDFTSVVPSNSASENNFGRCERHYEKTTVAGKTRVWPNFLAVILATKNS